MPLRFISSAMEIRMKHPRKILLTIWMCAMLAFGCATGKNEIAESAGQATPESAETEPGTDAYVIGPGDVLFISVWKNEAMTRTPTVLPDGNISFPLIGEVVAEGKTVAELKKEMEERLSRFVLDLVLSVEVRQINSILIYVIGRVNHPGRFALNTHVNVLQALSIAGGLNPFAKRNQIRIFRETGNTTAVFDFRYDEVSEGRHLEQNIRLRRGDVIVVP